MSRKSRRAESEIEGPFKTPEQLKLAMPLIATIGMMGVVCAVYLGASRPIVALIAVGGFGLCATAPAALIDLYVTRPLRGALAQIRAARDGKATKAAFASGVVADLVHLAHDVQAAHAHLGASGELFAQYEKIVAAGEDAARAFGQPKSEAPASDAPMEPAAQAEIAAIAEAVKAMRSAPAGLDGAVERLEAMLVYIAETLDRVEAKDRQIEGGVAQVEQGVADLTRLVARDTETLQGELSSGALHVRADIAGVVAEERLGRTRTLERIDALEARVVDRAHAADPRLGDDLRGLVETIARHVKTLAPGAIVDALQSQRTAGEHMRAEIGDLSDAVSRLAEGMVAGPAIETLRAELARMEAALLARTQSGEAVGHDLTGLREELSALVASVRQLIDEGHADAQAAAFEAAGSAGARLAQFGEVLTERWSAETGAQAHRLDEVERRVVERIVALGRENDAKTTAALLKAADGIGEAARRLDAASARSASPQDIQAIAVSVERLDAVTRQLDGARAPVEPLAERWGETEARIAGRLADVTARFDAFEAWALAGASRHFGVAQARIEEAAAKIEAGDPRLAEVAERTASLQARFDAFAGDSETRRFEAIAAAPQDTQAQLSALCEALRDQSDKLAARLDAAAHSKSNDADFVDTAQALGALGHILPAVARDLGDAQARWRDLLGEFETAAGKLAALADTDARGVEALRADFAAASAFVGARVERLARDAAPDVRQALDELRADFAATAAAAATKFDAASRDLTRTVEDRVEMLRRGELWPAIAAAQATAQDLHTAHAGLFTHVEAMKSALLGERSGVAALRLDVTEGFAKVAAVAERAELSAISQTLARTGERVEYAARTLEDRRGDLPALAADLKREIGALVRAGGEQARNLGDETRALAARLQDDVAARGRSVVEAVEENTARLDALARLQDERLEGLERRLVEAVGPNPVASTGDASFDARDLADLRSELGTVGETMRAALDRLSSSWRGAGDVEARSRALGPDPKPSGAVARLVVSMAEALDFRFSHIETALGELTERLQAPQGRADGPALDAGLARLALDLRSASQALKSGLSDFLGASAALAGEAPRAYGVEVAPPMTIAA